MINLNVIPKNYIVLSHILNMSENELNEYLSTSPELLFLENDIRRRLLATFFRKCVREYTVEQLSNIMDESEEDIRNEIGELVELNMIHKTDTDTYQTNRKSEIMQGYLKFSNGILSEIE